MVKFDCLLRACVVDLATAWLKAQNKQKKKADNSGLLNHDISGLWQVLQSNNLERTKDRIDSFIQWDDAWLLSVLRQNYFKHPARKDRSKADDLFFRLEELLSNKKWYYSVVKRVDEFSEIEDVFLQNIPLDFDWLDLGLKNEVVGNLKNNFEKAKANRDTAKETKETISGFFIDKLFEAFEICGQSGTSKEIVKAACQSIKGDSVAEVFFEFKKIKAGIKTESLLANSNGSSVRIECVSRIVAELREAGGFFPPFFVFVRPKTENEVGFKSDELIGMRSKVGVNMAKYVLSYQQIKGGKPNV